MPKFHSRRLSQYFLKDHVLESSNIVRWNFIFLLLKNRIKRFSSEIRITNNFSMCTYLEEFRIFFLICRMWHHKFGKGSEFFVICLRNKVRKYTKGLSELGNMCNSQLISEHSLEFFQICAQELIFNAQLFLTYTSVYSNEKRSCST